MGTPKRRAFISHADQREHQLSIGRRLIAVSRWLKSPVLQCFVLFQRAAAPPVLLPTPLLPLTLLQGCAKQSYLEQFLLLQSYSSCGQFVVDSRIKGLPYSNRKLQPLRVVTSKLWCTQPAACSDWGLPKPASYWGQRCHAVRGWGLLHFLFKGCHARQGTLAGTTCRLSPSWSQGQPDPGRGKTECGEVFNKFWAIFAVCGLHRISPSSWATG